MVVVLVNGLPGAGKTTLARPLALALGLPLLAKDIVKETLADVLGGGDRSWSAKLGAAAMETIWTVLASSPAGAVVEANLLRETRPFALAGLARAGVAPTDLIEVWCEVSVALARARFEARAPSRHAIHGQQVGLDQDWARWTATVEPIALGPVIRIDTSAPVDVEALVTRITAEMRAKGAGVGA